MVEVPFPNVYSSPLAKSFSFQGSQREVVTRNDAIERCCMGTKLNPRKIESGVSKQVLVDQKFES